MTNRNLYHGSSVGEIKIFKPATHKAVDGKKVVFATDNKLYALAMIYGTGDELAVSFSNNFQTGEKEIYIDELEKDKLKLLDNLDYLYEVDSKYFQKSPEGLEGEYISFEEVPILNCNKVKNILTQLKSEGVHLISYDDVPESMKRRGKLTGKSEKEHAPDRFK